MLCVFNSNVVTCLGSQSICSLHVGSTLSIVQQEHSFNMLDSTLTHKGCVKRKYSCEHTGVCSDTIMLLGTSNRGVLLEVAR